MIHKESQRKWREEELKYQDPKHEPQPLITKSRYLLNRPNTYADAFIYRLKP